MTGSTVASIEQDRPDSTGAIVCTVYSKVVPVYAVYRTEERMKIQYADDAALGSEQRQAAAGVSIVRGEIDGMIDELRASPDLRKHARANLVCRGVAEGLVLLLQGYAEPAAASLATIRDELMRERASSARLQYVLWASAAAIVVILVAGFVRSDLYGRMMTVRLTEPERLLWLAVAAGAVGAFFSIAIAVRRRELKAELIWRDNIADAVLRVVVAVIAAPLLVALLQSGAVALTIGGATISQTASSALLVVIVGFLGGFVERLVPDLLEKASVAAPTASTVPGRSAATPNELNPRGVASAPAPAGAAPAAGADPGSADQHADQHVDECLSEIDIDEDQQTQDEQLPEADGGVEKPGANLTGN